MSLTIINQIAELQKVTRAIFARVVDDISFPAWNVLRQLIEENDQRPIDIAHAIGVRPEALTKIIDSLVDAGYVDRREDPNDRRGVLIHLSDAKPVAAKIQEQEEKLTQVFGSTRITNIAPSITRLTSELRERLSKMD